MPRKLVRDVSIQDRYPATVFDSNKKSADHMQCVFPPSLWYQAHPNLEKTLDARYHEKQQEGKAADICNNVKDQTKSHPSTFVVRSTAAVGRTSPPACQFRDNIRRGERPGRRRRWQQHGNDEHDGAGTGRWQLQSRTPLCRATTKKKKSEPKYIEKGSRTVPARKKTILFQGTSK